MYKSYFLFFCVLMFSHVSASAETRVALVIGNGAYANTARLLNPRNDAEDVAAALRRTHFDVILGTDVGQNDMQDLAIRFARAASKADVAIFYYSGHALQFNGVNYLMPTDAKLADEADLKRFVRVDDILSDLQQAKNLRILVLDSCRDNPLADKLRTSSTRGATIGRGLNKMEAPLGTIISFSTQAGRIAEDGGGRNSPYTAAFIKHIEEPKEIGELFREVGSDVYEVSGKNQLPELSLSIVGKFYLNGPVSITIAPPAPPAVTDPCAAAESHWKAADAIGTIAAYEDHVARFASCAFSSLAKARIEALKQTAAAGVPPPVMPSIPKPARQGYDGEWDAVVSCPSVGNVGAYTTVLTGTVSNRLFHAEVGASGNPGWLVIDGKIGADGKATLIAKGLTGAPKSTLNNMKAGSGYGYTVSAKFDENSGTGKRNEDRPCTVTFARR